MMKWVALLGILFVGFACYPRSYQATATPQEGLNITYSVRPMFEFHSDWTRAVSVKYGATEIQQDLFEDTGWWRGSNLYRHKSGVYVIHEGQNGCFGFRVEPLSFDVQERISCEKTASTQQQESGASRYYSDLFYLGAFIETPTSPDGAPITFISASEKPEAKLPDLL